MSVFVDKPEILDALPRLGHGIIEASAGTGKTYTLERLVVELLLRHEDVELENILIVTFTEKATAELRGRVRKLLASIVSATHRPAGQKPAELGAPGWWIDDDARRKLERALFSFDVAPIYTIHGFCQRVLTEYAFASGRSFEQQHAELGPLFERAFTEAMRRTLSCRDETRDWLEAWLEVGSVDDLRDLLMRAMLSRAEIWPRYREEALTEGLEEFGDSFWETYRELYSRRCDKRERAFTLAQKDWETHRSVARFLMLVDRELSDFKHSLHNVDRSSPRHERFIKLASRLTRFKPAIAQRFLPLMTQALDVEKERQAVYTFDDMLLLVRDALRGPNGARLTQALRRRYRWALIDEFQDTDEVQWEIFENLFVERDDGGVVVIGDPKQAIYGFRNADVYTYIDACRSLERRADEGVAECARVQLEQNWRSSPRLIDGYNTILDQGAEQPFFTNEDIRYTHPVRPGKEALATWDSEGNEVAPIVLGRMKRREEMENAPLKTADVYTCYGRWVATEIRSILSHEGALYHGVGEDRARVRARDIYVLTRTHTDALRLEDHLRALDVPYVIHREEDLFATQEARAVLELLRAVERPHERSRRLKAWATPFFGVALEELVECRDVGEGHPLYRSLLTWSGLARQQRYEELFASVLQGSGIVRREVFGARDERALTNYLQLFEVLLEEARLGRVDFPELVARAQAFTQGKRKPLAADGSARRAEVDSDVVQIMTMHKSKGLEAPVVFVYAFGGFAGEFWPFHYQTRDGERVRALHILKPEAKIRPKLCARVEQESRQEDERLLYVALTRAEARLYLPLIPCVDGKPVCKQMSSRCYNVLNRKLDGIWLDGGVETESGPLFDLRDVPYFGNTMRVPERAIDEEALAAWTPREALLEEPSDDGSWRAERARALRVESYTSLKRRSGGYAQVDVAAEDLLVADDEVGTLEATISTRELPGGVRTGQFLHIALERLDYASLTKYEDALDQWKADPEVRALFERAMLEHGIGPQYMDLSQTIVHRALTGTVPLGDDGVIYGVGMCVPNVREMEFLYPIPERSHPAFGDAVDGALEIGRGFVKGYIDYVFEQWGRVYFVDWKSDILDRYDEATLGAHYEANYARQAQLYALALCKLLEIGDEEAYESRFGGAIYGFLRGMSDDGDQGWFYHRPTFAQVRAIHEELLGDEWGGGR